MSPNQKAFLDMIAVSEGTAHLGDNGYNVLVGGGLFHSYADHPHQIIRINDHLSSSAAGRYQHLMRYYDVYKKQLGLKDFSPASQDAIALQQIKECHALADIEEGDIASAIEKCAHIWASLPGAGYGQHENRFEALEAAYVAAGGTLA